MIKNLHFEGNLKILQKLIFLRTFICGENKFVEYFSLGGELQTNMPVWDKMIMKIRKLI
jgi:hypothetical protein